MNFDWTAEDREVRDRVKAVLDEPRIVALDVLDDVSSYDLRSATVTLLQDLAGVDYLSLGVGPLKKSEIMRLVAVQEELAKISGSFFLSVEVTARIFGGLIRGYGNSEDLDAIARAVERGALVGAVAVTEPPEQRETGTGQTTAWEDGSHYIVTGKKDFVTNGPIADYVAVSADVGGRLAVIVVKVGLPGVVIGSRMKTLGYDAMAVSDLELKQARVPKSFVLGPFTDQGALEFLLITEDLTITMASVGLMQRVVAAARKYSEVHKRSGKPILAHQEVRFKLAEMMTLYQTSQLLAFRAAWLHSVSYSEAPVVMRCAKVFSAEASERVAAMGMQIMAGRGYVRGNVMERAYRDAKYAALAGTTSERARMAIADELLNRYH